MIKSFATLGAVLALMIAGPLSAAPEFNVDTEAVGEESARVWLSYLAEGDVTAMEFTVSLDAPADIRGDARNCLASLPKSHRGLCRLVGNKLRGVIFSPTNASLPDTNLGWVVLDPNSLLKDGGAKSVPEITNVEVTTVNPQGLTVQADVRVSGQLAQTTKRGD